MSGQYQGEQDADIDLAGLFGALWRKKLVVLSATVICAGLGFGVAKVIAPKYQAETRILIDSRGPDFVNAERRNTPDVLLDDAAVTSQVQLLQSADLIKEVARKLKLYELKEFDPTSNPSVFTDIMVLLKLSKDPLDVPPEERVLREFVKKLDVYQVEKSRVIGIQFESEDPRLAAEIPNVMADVYLSLQSGTKLGDSQEETRWLEPEIANLREKVKEAEEKVARYRNGTDLIQTSETSTLANQQLSDISQELARVRGERADAEAKADNVRAVLQKGGNLETLGDVVDNPVIQRLKETQSTLEGQIADISTTHLDGHPQMKALRAQLTGIREQISRETRKILASLDNRADTAARRETQLVAKLNTLRAETAKANEQEVGLKALEREAASQRQLLENYLGRYREATSRQDDRATPADARIVSRAFLPDLPYFPKVLPITVVSALAGFILSSMFILLSELLTGRALKPATTARALRRDDASSVEPALSAAVDDMPRVRTAEETGFGLARPGAVPSALALANIDPETDAELADAAEDTINEEFSVRAVADWIASRPSPVTVCVSPTGDDGSTVTVMLVRRLAGVSDRVVLVDMTGSGLPSRLMAERPGLAGVTDLLSGAAPFGETIHPDRLSHAHIIPQGNSDLRRAMRAAGRLPMIIDALAEAYDRVVIECGPAGAANIAMLIGHRDAEVVISAGSATEAEIEAAMEHFIAAGYDDAALMLGGRDFTQAGGKSTRRGRA